MASYPLNDVFCFPIFYYPVFILISWLFFYIITKAIQIWVTYSQDSKEARQYIEESRIKTLDIFADVTPIPSAIAELIVEYIIDDSHERKIWKYMNKEIKLKHKSIMNYIRIYALSGCFFYILCIVIIILNFIEYSKNTTNSGWHQTLTWISLMLYGHPVWKFINCIASLWVLDSFDSNENHHDEKIYVNGYAVGRTQPVFGSNRDRQSGDVQCFYSLMSIGYFIIICGVAIPSLIVIIPALILYCPFVSGFGCILICFGVIIEKIGQESEYYQSLMKKGQIKLREMILVFVLICLFYVVAVIISESMICIYIEGANNGRYIGCLGGAFKMDYCPEFVFDSSNWQAWILLLTWIFF